MTPSVLKITNEIVMRVPLSGGRHCIVIWADSGTPDFAPLLEMNGAGMAQPTAPLFLKPLKENGAGAPLLHSAPLPSHEWRNTSPSGEFLGLKTDPKIGVAQKSVQVDLDEAKSALAFKSSEVADLDTYLQPAWRREQEVRQEILGTHFIENGVVRLNLDGARDRTGLFAQLDEISREFGPARNRRKILNGEIKGQKLIARLEKDVSKQKDKKHGKRS
jgi:hypothetical protein